jgi:hypothetical protein
MCGGRADARSAVEQAASSGWGRSPLTGKATTGLGRRSSRSEIPCLPISRSSWAAAARRTSLRPPRSATAGCRCTPRGGRDIDNEWLAQGFASSGVRRSREAFEICATANVVVTEDRNAAFAAMKPYLTRYVGGMGADDTNFHADVYRRMGYAEVVDDVTKPVRSERADNAATARSPRWARGPTHLISAGARADRLYRQPRGGRGAHRRREPHDAYARVTAHIVTTLPRVRLMGPVTTDGSS